MTRPSTETVIERAAKAVYARSETYPDYALAQMNEHLAADFACAVLESLLPPDEGMIEGGDKYMRLMFPKLTDGQRRAVINNLFDLMIQSALTPKASPDG